MKKLVVVLCALLVCSCTKELSSDQLFEINGLSYEANSQTPFTGRVIDFHENGQLERKEFYKDGFEDGPWEFYYADGQIKKKESYKDGKPDGTWEMYHENGQLRSRGFFKNAELNGALEIYSEDGLLMVKDAYVNGKRISE